MKAIGIVLLIIGSLAFLVGFNMDTSVATDFGGRRVHNIGLINDRQNIVIFAGVLAVIGALFVALAGKNKLSPESASVDALTRKCPFCAETIKAEAKICRFCQKELPPTPSYNKNNDTETTQEASRETLINKSLSTKEIFYLNNQFIAYGKSFQSRSDAASYIAECNKYGG